MNLKKVGVIEEKQIVSYKEALSFMGRGYSAICLHLEKDYVPEMFGDIDYSETEYRDGQFVNRYGHVTLTENDYKNSEELVKQMKESQWKVVLKRPVYVIEASNLNEIEIEEVPSHQLLRKV